MMRVSFQVILPARATVKMSNFLRILLRHVSFSSEIATEVALDALLSEAPASLGASVACYCKAENVFIFPIVKSEDELVHGAIVKCFMFIIFNEPPQSEGRRFSHQRPFFFLISFS
jgi:hypothetical protein